MSISLNIFTPIYYMTILIKRIIKNSISPKRLYSKVLSDKHKDFPISPLLCSDDGMKY